MGDPHERETRERWGETQAYAQSRERMARYSAEDIEMAKKQAAAAVDMFVEAMDSGQSADSPAAAGAAEAHRAAISDWWYACSYDMQANLAAMYVEDPRFRAHYDEQRDGLAQYVHDAIIANAIARA